MTGRVGVCRRAILIVVGLVCLTTLMAGDRNNADLQWHLVAITAPYSFHLVYWEVDTLARRLHTALFPPPAVADPVRTVLTYFSLGQKENLLTDRLDQLAARQATDPRVTPALEHTEREIAAIQRERNSLRPNVEQIISQQVDDQLRRDGVRPGLLTFHPSNHFPFLRPWLIPGVFFGLGGLPHLLVVAPRDRIEIIGTVLLSDDLSVQSMNRIESATDQLGVSSVVIHIGGLAAYPAMIPDDEPLEDTLITICHEWAFHYLALHPLGQRYFSSYDMATINESLVDIVGHELGPEVYDRYYRAAVEATEAKVRTTAPSRSEPAAAPPPFPVLLRRIREVVQADLARGDVQAADAYMAQQQQVLLHDGYYVRRLNTAFLAFYGWYADGGNPYAPLLREIRQKSGSLAAFLADVQDVTSPEQLRQLAAEPAAELRWR